MEKVKNKKILTRKILLGIAALTFMVKNIYIADGLAKSITNFSFDTWMLAPMAIFYGALMFGLFYLISTLSYNSISRSKFFPFNDLGVCAVSKDDYLIKVLVVAIATNVVMAVLNNSLYACSVMTAFVTMVLNKVVAVISVLVFDLWLAHSVAKGKAREFTVAMAMPSVMLIIALGA